MRTLCASILATTVLAVTAAESEEMHATSPDGRVKCAFAIEDGVPVVDVSFCGKHAFRTIPGVECGRVRLAKSASRTIRRSWKPAWGFKSEYPENFSELKLTLVHEGREGREPPAETLYLRCYDEGFAVRAAFVLNPYSVSSVSGERTSWHFAPRASAWAISGTEATFPADPIPLERLDEGQSWRMPFTLDIPDVAYASVFEAHTEHYPRSYLHMEKGELDGDPTERTFYRDFRDFNPFNDLGSG